MKCSSLERVNCDCGRRAPRKDGKPLYVADKAAICERCYNLQKDWRWSRYNPNCTTDIHPHNHRQKAKYWQQWAGLPFATLGRAV